MFLTVNSHNRHLDLENFILILPILAHLISTNGKEITGRLMPHDTRSDACIPIFLLLTSSSIIVLSVESCSRRASMVNAHLRLRLIRMLSAYHLQQIELIQLREIRVAVAWICEYWYLPVFDLLAHWLQSPLLQLIRRFTRLLIRLLGSRFCRGF